MKTNNASLPASGQYAVTVSYSFDTDGACYLFDDEEKAKKFLREAWEAETLSDKENGYNSVSEIFADGYYAAIRNYYHESDATRAPDVTEFRICSVYCTDEQETHPKTPLDAFIEEEVPFRLKEFFDMEEPSEELVAACICELKNDTDIMFDYDAIDDAIGRIVDEYAEKEGGEDA